MSTRRSYVRTLRPAGLLDKTSSDSAGAYDKWIHRFGQHDIGLHIDENLELEKQEQEPMTENIATRQRRGIGHDRSYRYHTPTTSKRCERGANYSFAAPKSPRRPSLFQPPFYKHLPVAQNWTLSGTRSSVRDTLKANGGTDRAKRCIYSINTPIPLFSQPNSSYTA
jgi:hypothetical protein